MFDANAIRLKACRRRCGLDQAELALLLGTYCSTISRLERSRALPDTKTLLAYELMFDIPATKLLPDTSHELKRRVCARAAQLKKRLDATPGQHSPGKVEFVRNLHDRFGGPSP